MKKTLLITFSMLVSLASFSQNTTLLQTDSLMRALTMAKDDTSRVLIMTNLTEGFRGAKPDSAVYFGQKALQLAREINYPDGEVRALLGLCVVFRELGSLPKALEIGFKALKIAEENNLQRDEGASLVRIANVYAASKNYQDAQNYYKKADEKLKGTGDQFLISASYFLSADVYEKMNLPDSALIWAELALQEVSKMQSEILWPGLLRVFGNIYARKGNNELAREYFHRSIVNGLKLQDHRNVSSTFTDFAIFFKKINRIDSAIYYGKKALEYATLLSYKNLEMKAAMLLSELYETSDVKEAFRYYKLSNEAKDSLYSSEKVQALQTMTFEEQDRKREQEAAIVAYQNRIKQYALLAGLAIFLVMALILYRNNRHKQKANALLEQQKKEIQATLSELKVTQSQLIHSEKMASLGELTAGIAHEIQNPLNFVNNFSEVNTELIDELEQEANSGNLDAVRAITRDIKENEQKINHHGKRADSIVKGMLQHSRSSSGQKEPTDINALADEYLRLSYHGIRAKDNSFNATLKTDFDSTIEKINIIPQDIGRVILNLIANAFYAVDTRRKQETDRYESTVSVSTKKIGNKIELKVSDNGNGIPSKVLDKIFQPFFTTKPTGQGTGLGLSLSYDIVKAHGGDLTVSSDEGRGAEFILILPTNS